MTFKYFEFSRQKGLQKKNCISILAPKIDIKIGYLGAKNQSNIFFHDMLCEYFR